MVTLRRVGAAALLAGLLTCLPSVAMAQTPEEDPRATQHDGNAVAKDCPQLWPGSTAVQLTDSDPSKQYIDITSVPDGVEVVGVVVKGGDGYNTYDAPDLGALPWLDLYSPLNNGGNIPDVSHWFACGVKDTTTTTTTTTSSGTTTTTAPGETTTDVTPTTDVPTSPEVTTTTAPGAPGEDDDLADTGANPGWLLLTGLLLLAGGGLALFSPKVRAAFARR
ncbi:hypothetical protein [Actinokineospora sp. UTMC 2448]|uniref:hypothetical protein n=1 Tax=Actinokineospora sp. UTMC 2448 TaxID=2268449 RepID=UPI0021640D1F|nr:hypothetical protein [Actinokineospora sp. UTMC 2448]UVS76930.1 hypothetical protein Actkin_00627 [Actinokineospora sp. UTMC 2448]